MTKIVVFTQKGGVGKTTIAANILASLNFNYPDLKLLAVDLDSQGHLTTILHSNPSTINPEETVYRLFKDTQYKGTDVIHNSRFEHVDIIPSSLSLFEVGMNPGLSSSHVLLKDFLSGVENKYDFVITDVPQALDVCSYNGLIAADYLLMPVELAPLCQRVIPDMMKTYEMVKKENPNLKVLGILPNMVDKKLDYQNIILDSFKESEFKDYLLEEFSISKDDSITKALTGGKTIFELDDKGPSHTDFKKFTDWIYDKCVGTGPFGPSIR